MDAIPPQGQDLAFPHRRRPGERKEGPHLTITRSLVPKIPELRRRDDAITAWRFGPLPHGCDGIPVEAAALHREIEDAVHDRAVVIDAGRRELPLRGQVVQEGIDDTTPPTLSLPDSVVARPTSATGAVVDYPPATASDLVDGAIAPTCLPPRGFFPIGSTTVECAERPRP